METKVRCKKCGEVIQSSGIEHLVTCKCRSIAVYGRNTCFPVIGSPDDWYEIVWSY